MLKPDLSVIVTTYNAEKTVVPCLQSLFAQKTDKLAEIIVVDSSQDRTARIVREQFPQVRLFHFENRKFCGDARNIGIAQARADIVAFIDADCTATPDWMKEILRAHRSSAMAVGGAIMNKRVRNPVAWAAYFCEFSRFMPGLPAAWLDDMAGANVSYKKEIFQRFGILIEGTYCSDTEFHWRLKREGVKIHFMPSIQVTHDGPFHFRKFIVHEFEHGRYFGCVRVKYQPMHFPSRMIYTLLFWLIPFKLYSEILMRNAKSVRFFPYFILASPFLLIALYAWSLGECMAYSGVFHNE
jgi:glycosyltransferase involved in cell wall biosynthesis